ncbi:acyl-CoA thioesterase [Metabacillus rhizolycopersici]|uniref:Acyl-CoA thioesterase n=1 Tax=Metabacillus rhizolycopersici TaxID=2875709 RepID=A0ABS7UP10_9BACI|nr:thioesterase family protein [Metabacillus rhizolycopersici]MBZ5750015.1 acyl-CoA thioesterase [Metabacillus rhizolycopersici]
MLHESFVRTRYFESDVYGHINNVSFFIYLEQARVDFFADNNLHKNQEEWSFVVASAHCDYINQAYVNQNLVIRTYIDHIGRKSIKLKHQIMDQASEELIAEGEVVLVHFNFKTQLSEPLDEELIKKLSTYLA